MLSVFRYVPLALLLGLAGRPLIMYAQAATPHTLPYQAVDARMRQIPDSSTHTVSSLARYINASFTAETDKARAAFVWVARNIRYDRENMYLLEFEREPAEVVQETLSKRRGVCRHYAELYKALASAVGVPTYVVPGYTSLRDAIGHAWCASRIEGQWYLMDPTWALETRMVNGKPLVVFRDDYFRMRPAQAIESHMPFDPLWQLLKAPRTPEQFQYGQVPAAPAKAFAYLDSLAVYERQSPLEQLRAVNRRIEKNGVRNGLTFTYLSGNRTREENLHIGTYNAALQELNAGAEQLNAFVDFFNHQFLPRKTDAELVLLLPPAAAHLARSRELLASLPPLQNPAQQINVRQVATSLREVETLLENSQAFLARYLGTGKLLRPTLFMQISTLNGRHEMQR